MGYKQQYLACSKLNESFLLQKVRSAAGGLATLSSCPSVAGVEQDA